MKHSKTPLPGAVLLLAALGFVLGTGEFVIVGILPEIAEGLDTSLAAVGKLVSVFAACYAVGTPVITAACGGISRKKLLAVLMGVFLLTGAVSFAAPNVAVLYAARVAAALVSGTLTAVVGHSGSGKTTLLMLLARFWDVQGGAVSLGGIDVRDIPQKDLMAEFSVVFQDVYLFAGTIRENIRMGRPDASPEAIIEAAKAAGCHDFIMALPEGYDTLVGEGGCTLSGGERQRVSIARAILKDASVVLLDEAFSSVDPENAWAIQQGLSVLTRRKTVIMVAHTLNHIRHADQILVMDAGKPVERGTHDALLAKGGLYRQLWERESSVKSWKLTA